MRMMRGHGAPTLTPQGFENSLLNETMLPEKVVRHIIFRALGATAHHKPPPQLMRKRRARRGAIVTTKAAFSILARRRQAKIIETTTQDLVV